MVSRSNFVLLPPNKKCVAEATHEKRCLTLLRHSSFRADMTNQDIRFYQTMPARKILNYVALTV